MTRSRASKLMVGALIGLVVSFLAAGASSSVVRAAPLPGTPAASLPVATALEHAFEAGRRVSPSAVGGIRTGSLHVGSAGGQEWAIASFTPARSAPQNTTTDFQDGAATGTFTETNGAWSLVQTGLYECGAGLPAALATAWDLARPQACTASGSSEQSAATQTLSTLPASAQAAAKAAGRPGAGSSAAPGTTTDFGETIAAIALSQVGVQDNPVVTNFDGVDCNPFTSMVAGFSADSDGCGFNSQFGVENENETWCSDFNKWVWERAGITADMNTLNAGSVSFYDWALDQGQNPQLDTGTPALGDSILFFAPGEFPTFADHVGIVAAVNADGSINMVNGDFEGGPDVSAQYDTGITDLSSFAASVEGPGEQWVIVTPPTTAQQPAPTGRLVGPPVAVAGTTGAFHASGAVRGGSVSGYYWTFGDGRTTNASGADQTHYFSEAGTYPVTVTITSSFGTVVTLEQSIHVVAPSSSVASAPFDGVYYDPLPILQYQFVRSAGGLAVDTWDGGSWLQLSVPGDPSSSGGITALSYPDTANADNMTPHAYYRSADGSLAETSQSTSGWVTQTLPGEPVAGGAIVATTTVSGAPAVFFIDAAGNLSESTPTAGAWTAREVVRGGSHVDAASLSLADTTAGTTIFATGAAGTLWSFTSHGSFWSEQPLAGLRTTPGGSLAALTTPDGNASVLFVDARGGGLAQATEAGPLGAGPWRLTALPGAPRAGTTLAATTYLLPSAIPATPGDFPSQPGSIASSGVMAPLGTEAFYLTAAGAPAVSFDDGTGWKTATLPGTATAVVGATAYQVEEEPSNVFLTTSTGLTEETTGARSGDPSGGTWTSIALPAAPATQADRIVLYAADPADTAAAQAAAEAAGLPATQVITSFAQAWGDTLSGEYVVLAVGSPAVGALFFNTCGWANPSALPAGSTPFSYVLGPVTSSPGVDLFVNSAADTAADTQALATDLAFFALNGALPAGVTTLPAAVAPTSTCVGSPT